MNYVQTVIVVVALTLIISIAFPRLTPIVLRVGLIALVIIAAFWLYNTLRGRPPPLASRILKIIKEEGPVSRRELVQRLEADPDRVEEALKYLVERGLVRSYKKDGEIFYD